MLHMLLHLYQFLNALPDLQLGNLYYRIYKLTIYLAKKNNKNTQFTWLLFFTGWKRYDLGFVGANHQERYKWKNGIEEFHQTPKLIC